MPLNSLKNWIKDEEALGALNPQHAILATATKEGVPHSRVVAIREISEEGLVFFSQRGTRKVAELTANPVASLTFWFELKLRQVVIEGNVVALTNEENAFYWQNLPRERQLRFSAYAPTSGQLIESSKILETKKLQLLEQYENSAIPVSPQYVGFRLLVTEPSSRIYFYTLGTTTFSEIIEYRYEQSKWKAQNLSP